MDYLYDIITYVDSNFFAKKGLVIFGGFLLILLVYSFATNSKTLHNIHFAQSNVGNLSREELSHLVDEKIDAFNSRGIEIKLKNRDSRDKRVSTTFENLGIKIDKEASVDQVFSKGKSGVFAQDFFLKLRLIFSSRNISPIYSTDYQKFSLEISRLTSDQYLNAIDASVVFAGGSWQVTGESDGQNLDYAKLTSDIRARVVGLSSEPIEIMFVRQQPRVRSEHASEALAKIKVLSNQRINLEFGSDSWQLGGKTLVEMIEFSPKGLRDGYVNRFLVLGDPIDVKFIRTEDSKPLILDLVLADKLINSFLDGVSASVDQQTVDATISFDGEKVTQFTPARDGQKLNIELARLSIQEKISVDNHSADKTIIINLPVEVTLAKIANEEINSLGIKELVGRGVSYFAGSIPNRAYNVSLGSKRISGTIVKPGENFSFNRSVGEVSGATGYKQAYVISSGRTVLDDGGGICQVSTTVFRAALNAGLPIVTRTAHAYRVGYYEQRGVKAGYDATVWAPAVDLVFKNDTSHHILVQTVVDPVQARLEVDIYGTKDDRRVELSDVQLSNNKPAPEARYQDDPTLPNGTVKQVDFSAQGATSVFARKVYKDSKLLIDESFKSVYRPWQAVYLVGTGT